MRDYVRTRRPERQPSPLSLFSQLPKPRPGSSSHKRRPSQILRRSLLNPQPKPQMNPSWSSRGYQRVTLYAGIRNIIPLILDLGGSLNFTIDSRGPTSCRRANAREGRNNMVNQVVSDGSHTVSTPALPGAGRAGERRVQ